MLGKKKVKFEVSLGLVSLGLNNIYNFQGGCVWGKITTFCILNS